MYLTEYLKSLYSVTDVRETNRKTFKMHLYGECDTIEEAYEKILGIK